MKIIPEGKRLLVLPIKAEEQETAGGIAIPAGVAVSDLSKAKVVEVSPQLSHKFKKGDTLLYASGAGQAQYYNGEYHLWLAEREFDSDIWGIEIED